MCDCPIQSTCYPKPSSWRSWWRGACPIQTALALDPPPPSQFAPMPVWYYGICAEKNSVSIQLATNKTNTTCHSGLSQPPTTHPPSTSHAGLLQHPIYIFIGQLSPSLCSLSGSRAFSNRGNLSHSLIERLSGDYEEVSF